MKIKQIVVSWDFLVAVLISVITAYIFPGDISNNFAKDIFSIGISVLSIVFSVYFAALAIIISSGDNKFIQFLEDDGGHYSILIGTFKFSLMVLFIALIISLLFYGYSSSISEKKQVLQPSWMFILFLFMFLYGLFATLCSTLDAIKYAKFRTRFLLAERENKCNDN